MMIKVCRKLCIAMLFCGLALLLAACNVGWHQYKRPRNANSHIESSADDSSLAHCIHSRDIYR